MNILNDSLGQVLEIIVLGIIQGLTEWLPISSTGHIEIARFILGLKLPLLFDVILHVGTLIVTVVFFREDIKVMIAALLRFNFESENGKMISKIIIGSIPTMAIGLIFSKFVEEEAFHDALSLGAAFLISGLVIYASKIGKNEKDDVSCLSAIIVGIAQGVSLIPGLSRSGLTIATAMLLGIKREKAFKFSFLLSIPAIIGALSLMLYTENCILFVSGIGCPSLFAGTMVAMILGYITMKILRRVLHRLHLFAFYCIPLGLSLMVIGLVG